MDCRWQTLNAAQGVQGIDYPSDLVAVARVEASQTWALCDNGYCGDLAALTVAREKMEIVRVTGSKAH
jgi:hypothetical protein